jgi:hypothetical protein
VDIERGAIFANKNENSFPFFEDILLCFAMSRPPDVTGKSIDLILENGQITILLK